MLRRLRLLLGISVFWLALSMLSDGVNTLVLPLQITGLFGSQRQSTILGLLTFVGLLAAAVAQPFAGALSDRLRPRLGRRGFVGIGLLLSLAALACFATVHNLSGLALGYLAIQLSGSLAQAGQQGLIPDLIDERQRGTASGLKGFMDIAGAMLGFAVLGQLLGSGHAQTAIAAIGAALVLTYAVAVLLTPEDRAAAQRSTPRPAPPLLHSLHIDVHRHRAFVRLVVARFLFLLGVYATGRFLLYFVQDRLGLEPGAAAAQAGNILAALALATVIASPVAGWLADRVGRLQMMVVGSILGAASAALLIFAHTSGTILLFGSLMSVASAAFSGGSWALLADLAPKQESARYFGLANFSTAGAAALAGLLGPLIDVAQHRSPGSGYTIVFLLAALAFISSAFPLNPSLLKEVHNVRSDPDQGQVRPDPVGLAVLPLPADPAGPEEDPHPPRGAAAA